MYEVRLYLNFLYIYARQRVINLLVLATRLKRAIIVLLLLGRGKYTSHISNVSFLLLMIVVITNAPTIARNHPFKSELFAESNQDVALDETYITLDEADISINTIKTEGIRDKVIVYELPADESVKVIADKFEVSEKSIAWLNKTTNQTLKKGTRVKIPPVTGVIHTVEPGDNIYAIANKYQVNPQNIVNFPFNEFKDGSFTLIAGSELMVPGGTVVEPKAPVVSDSYSFAQVVAGVRGSSNFIWPTNGIVTQYPASYHMALDIANPANPPVIASDAGTVIYSGCFSWGYGCHVIIDHGNGYRSLYGHLLRRDVEQGATVSQGQQVGIMGSTGRSTGTHLHFEIRQGSTLLNPQSFLR